MYTGGHFLEQTCTGEWIGKGAGQDRNTREAQPILGFEARLSDRLVYSFLPILP